MSQTIPPLDETQARLRGRHERAHEWLVDNISGKLQATDNGVVVYQLSGYSQERAAADAAAEFVAAGYVCTVQRAADPQTITVVVPGHESPVDAPARKAWLAHPFSTGITLSLVFTLGCAFGVTVMSWVLS